MILNNVTKISFCCMDYITLIKFLDLAVVFVYSNIKLYNALGNIYC